MFGSRAGFAKGSRTLPCFHRFTVGSTVRYPPGRSDAANKARLYHFEALRKIYFYDAWRSEPELGRKDSSLQLPPAPGKLQQGCYWRPKSSTSIDPQVESAQSPANDTPAGSSVSDDPIEHSPSAILPSPDSIDSGQNHPVRPVSVSSREEAESSPTQASEPTAPSVATVTSPTGDDETPVHEVSSRDSPTQVATGAEDKEEEVLTEDPVVEQEDENDDEDVWEVEDSSSLTHSGHYATEGEAHSQSVESPRSMAPRTAKSTSSNAHPPLEKQLTVRGLPLQPILANCQGIGLAPLTAALRRKATAQAVVLQMNKA